MSSPIGSPASPRPRRLAASPPTTPRSFRDEPSLVPSHRYHHAHHAASPSLSPSSPRRASPSPSPSRQRFSRPHSPSPSLLSLDDLPANLQLPPRPSDLPDHPGSPSQTPTPTRSPSPSHRLSTLVRQATKHARSQSTPTATMFAGVLSKLKPAAQTAPASTNRPPPTDIIDEFSGLDFSALLSSYLVPPTSPPSSPGDALLITPQGRLEAVVKTAGDMLDRVYSAYRKRTEGLADTLGEIEVQKEDLAAERTRCEDLRRQVERLAAEREAMALRMEEQERLLHHMEMEREKRRKRDSAASAGGSDSGFESDADSCFSREVTCEEEPTPTRVLPRSPRIAVESAEVRPPPPPQQSGGWNLWKPKQPSPLQERTVDRRDTDQVRMENRMLRARVMELESAVEGALEAVAGRRL